MNATTTIAYKTTTTTTDDPSIRIYQYSRTFCGKTYTILLSDEFKVSLLTGKAVLEDGKTFQQHINQISTTTQMTQLKNLVELTLNHTTTESIVDAKNKNELESLSKETLEDLWSFLYPLPPIEKTVKAASDNGTDPSAADTAATIEQTVARRNSAPQAITSRDERVVIQKPPTQSTSDTTAQQNVSDDTLKPSTSDTTAQQNVSDDTLKPSTSDDTEKKSVIKPNGDHTNLKMMALGVAGIACLVMAQYHDTVFTAIGDYFGINN
jgi:hypothetical protein